MKRCVSVLLCCVMTAFAQVPSSGSVRGVWKIVEETTTDMTNSNPQPGFIIFTEKYYSLIHVASPEPRPDSVEINKATGPELLSIWGDAAFGANSGTYDLAGAALTLHSLVAKNPWAMTRVTGFTYRIEGDNLWLRFNQRTDARTFKLRRLE
jgi:hypothetical protein